MIFDTSNSGSSGGGETGCELEIGKNSHGSFVSTAGREEIVLNKAVLRKSHIVSFFILFSVSKKYLYILIFFTTLRVTMKERLRKCVTK